MDVVDVTKLIVNTGVVVCGLIASLKSCLVGHRIQLQTDMYVVHNLVHAMLHLGSVVHEVQEGAVGVGVHNGLDHLLVLH